MDNEKSLSPTVVEDSPGRRPLTEELQSGTASEQDKDDTEYMPMQGSHLLSRLEMT